ncbi:MAG TPA: hypothetical protein VIC03_05300 [Gemmatimonadaceae bacterium]|jgi:hypothetical protein
MSETLVQFDEPQLSADGRMFIAQVRGEQVPTGLWEAWLEFQPRIGGEPVRTAPETEQLSRGDLRFWAAGITRAHLAEALERALHWHSSGPTRPVNSVTGASSAAGHRLSADPVVVAGASPILDPIALYQRSGEYTLRQELRELDARRLADIIGAFGIDEVDVLDLARTYEDALAEKIVASVQQRVESIRTFSPKADAGLTK